MRATIQLLGEHGKAVCVLTGVLFDLDGTLLDIHLDDFFRRYFAALGPAINEIMDEDRNAHGGLDAVMRGTEAMCRSHPGQTNREAFNTVFRELTGADLAREDNAAVLERFYAEVFPTLREAIGPHPGARESVECALDLGLKVAIATNPIFPRAAIEERMRWANVADLPVDLVTSYENMHSAKPHGSYYSEIASMLDIPPSKALMVGDDRVLDMAAADVGMQTYLVGGGTAPVVDYAGTLAQLPDLLTRLVRAESDFPPALT
jgi:FMN phosphatase YigB (HAD superfamily)